MKLLPKKRPQSVLGLSFEGGQLRAFLISCPKGEASISKELVTALTLDPMQQEVDLVARELRNHLDAAGIKEHLCIVNIPSAWLMSQHVKVPELSAEDTQSFLSIEAERGFPCAPEQLQISNSKHSAGGAAFVTQFAVRKEQLERLLAILRAAKLKPLSFSVGLLTLPGATASTSQGRITVEIGSHGAALLISAGSGIITLRTCDALIESESGERVLNQAAVARELRITLEQVPAELRAELHEISIIGDDPAVSQLAGNLADWAKASRLRLSTQAKAEGQIANAALQSLVAHWLTTGSSILEFLPPSPSRFDLLLSRYSSKRLATAGFATAGVIAIIIIAFVGHIGWSWALSAEWSGMKTQVTELDGVQKQIREFRPWYDTSFSHLSLLQKITEAFPESGNVTAKTVEIRNGSIITISGVTRDNAALLKTLDQLRKMSEVSNLKVDQIRGKSPVQFTFNFHWSGNSGS